MKLSLFAILVVLVGNFAPSFAEAMDPEAKQVFDYWTPEKMAGAKPMGVKPEGGRAHGGARGLRTTNTTNSPNLRSRNLQQVVDADWTGGGTLNEAVGRLLFRSGNYEFLCTGTVIQDGNTQGRSLILTAAHCCYEHTTGEFNSNFLFIPRQDDGGADLSNGDCSDDPTTCTVANQPQL